ncbi:hypothetical protein BDN70DRAFT_993337 [Pholiota conissans]|uniref:DUF7918 domain-containing protein n=1 Tax=Pholiota conissans TaxID=109636 RepID=A0A9P5Z2P8_9AGAR|nr:hypothetical protein BDN70DRAFT_993337 [Pholiota conissans]
MERKHDHLNFSEFDVWIDVDGVKTPTYGVESKGEEGQTSCWIASAADKEFSISFCPQRSEENAYIARVLLDGHEAAHNIYPPIPNTGLTKTISARKTSATEQRNFVFGKLELTDDDSVPLDQSQHIGEIKVMIRRAKVLGFRPHAPPTHAVPDAERVHERSKKALSHQVKYGPEQKIVPKAQVGVTYVPLGDWMTFLFKYRPIEMLRANGIAPPLPSTSAKRPNTPESMPPPSEVKKRNSSTIKRELNDDSEDDELEDSDGKDMLSKERELLVELERVRKKQRAKMERARPKKKIKNEPTTHFTPGEVIDLT